MHPRVSIVIPFYNDPYVRKAIKSALAQTYSNIEIIVVDDGSTKYANRAKKYSNRVHYWVKGNGGTASALNHGIRHASGEYIAWLSSDDLFYPTKLQEQIAFMQAENAQICYSSYDVINSRGKITQQHVAVPFPNYGAFVRSLINNNPINGCTVVASKQLLLGFGLFNEGLIYTHDYDLWLRILLARVPFHYINRSLIQYRIHPSMGTVKRSHVIAKEIAKVQHCYAPLLNQFARELGSYF